MITLKDFLKTQHQFDRSNPYKYEILFVLDIEVSDTGPIVKIKHGDIYKDIDFIPKDFYDRLVYSIEPYKSERSEVLYLKILLL